MNKGTPQILPEGWLFLFDSKSVKRSIRFNHDHLDSSCPTFGLPWRVIDASDGTMTFAKAIKGMHSFETELVEHDGEIKGNLVITGYFFMHLPSWTVVILPRVNFYRVLTTLENQLAEKSI